MGNNYDSLIASADLDEAVPQYCDSVARECIAYSFYILLTVFVSSPYLLRVRCCAVNVRTSWSLDVRGNNTPFELGDALCILQ